MNRIDKAPSITNTVIRKSSSFEESSLLPHIKNFLLNKKKRSMSDNSLLECRPVIKREEKQAKTVVTQASPKKRPHLFSNNLAKSSQDMIFSDGSSSVDISLKKICTATNTTTWRSEDGLKIKKWESARTSEFEIKNPPKIPKYPFIKEFSSNRLICEPVPEKGNEDNKDSSSDYISLSQTLPDAEIKEEIQVVSRQITYESHRRLSTPLISPLNNNYNSLANEKNAAEKDKDKHLELFIDGSHSSLALRSNYTLNSSFLKDAKGNSTIIHDNCCCACVLI